MWVLGLNTMENSSACLVCDGRIIAAAEEERFTRVKHQEGVPVQAIKYCFRQGGINLANVDIVALSWQPWRIAHRMLHVLRFMLISPRRFLVKARRGVGQVTGDEWRRMITLPWKLSSILGEDHRKCKYRFVFVDHHFCHAASAFYPSPFSRAAILTLDGAGESACVTFNRGEGTQIFVLNSIRLPHSLGHLYSAVTAFLGFRVYNGEGKVMGLAAYGEDNYHDVFEQMVKLKDNGRIKISFKWFDYHLARSGIFPSVTIRKFGFPRRTEESFDKRHEDIAASLQDTLERAVLHLTKELNRRTGLESLCLAGGVALNAQMNGTILKRSPFRQFFIQPVAGDAGTALGAALAAARPAREDQRYPMRHLFLGPGFDEKAIGQAICKKGLKAMRCSDIANETAKLLAAGQIVGWFQGRMEFGPRALGSRSILADPRKAEMKGILNQRVKRRESFRPYAPSVLAERAGDYFSFPTESPFMIQVASVRAQVRELIPAVVHVDGTARLQTVRRETNPMFYRLIEEFCSLTKIPVVLNTSFNVRGEPIVCTPSDAIACYMATGMDALAIGDFLLTKNGDDSK